MKKIIGVFLVVMLLAGGGFLGMTESATYAVAVSETWVARYNGPDDNVDEASGIVIDGLGNVYVTGTSMGSGTSEDFATMKYDADGTVLWVTRYNGPADGTDEAEGIAVDVLGNVYVSGMSEGNGSGEDSVTLKYDPDGNELWVARYDGPVSGTDEGGRIVVDTSGNAYVAGTSEGDGTAEDIVLIKYDADGNELWVARYNGPSDGEDGTESITTDESGYVYVVGGSEGGGTDVDVVVIKYDADGNELWVVRYDGPVGGLDETHAVVVDGSGNVYVTGVSEGIGTGEDYVTIKYDPDGNMLWLVRYDGPASGDDGAKPIAIDGSGNVYVTGGSEGIGTDSDYATIKYVVVEATVDLDPDILNLKSGGKWVTTYIELPEGYGVADIDATTVLLNDTVPAVTDPKYDFVTDPSKYITDNDKDGVLERMVKFDRFDVQSMLEPGDEVELRMWGQLTNGTLFEGTDTITVIE